MQLVERGNFFAAIKLVRRTYNYNLTEAKEFVEEDYSASKEQAIRLVRCLASTLCVGPAKAGLALIGINSTGKSPSELDINFAEGNCR